MTSDERVPAPLQFNCADQGATTWLERAAVCADLLALLPPTGGRPALADIGCGDRKLRAAIEARGLPFTYHGYDLQPQTPDVERFDVRCDPLPRSHFVVVMLGVIEYLSEVRPVLQRLARHAPHLLLSHVVRQHDIYSPQRLRELGWLHHLRIEELEQLLTDAGYDPLERRFTQDQRTLVMRCSSRVYGAATPGADA